MKKLVLAILLCSLAGACAWAQKVVAPRAKEPLMLADFERPEDLAKWTGLKPQQTDAHASAGRFGMQVTLPKWEKGMNEWPAVYLSYDGGKGYPAKDWSHYGKVAFDAWVEGDKAASIALELRDRAGHNGTTTRFAIEPGKVNHCELPLEDLADQANLANIEEIVLFDSRPAREYVLTFDALRLLPGDKPPLAELDLAYPNYRGLIFPGAGGIEVAAALHAEEYDLKPGDLQITLTATAGEKTASASAAPEGAQVRVRLAAEELPAGPVALTAAVVKAADGTKLAEKSWQARKLTAEEAGALKVIVDRNNNTLVAGKPFFPLGWYDGADDKHLAEIADSPFNCLLDYGTNHVAKARMLEYLDKMQQAGLKLIYCLNDVYPTATYFEQGSWEGVKGNDEIAAAVVKAYRDHPAILAWYLNDELPRGLVPKLTDYYDRVKAGDPNHPCYIVLCTMAELKYFPETTDVLGVDPYPIPGEKVTRVSEWMEDASASVGGHKPVWLVPQAFAWYQYGPDNKDRGHKPTEAELKKGRAPTYEEERCMTYLALAHGAKGLIYYCYYDLRVLPQYNEMWGWMKKIGGEVKSLFPVLLSPEDLGTVRFEPAKAPIHTKLKRCEGRLTLIAVNAGDEKCKVKFDLGRQLGASAEVMFEGRKVATEGAGFSDEFAPLEAHVYDLGIAK